jgi:hypothetical protein
MGDIVYTEDVQPRMRRVGGYYQSVESIELAASLLNFNVVVGPRHSKWGFYMVPAPLSVGPLPKIGASKLARAEEIASRIEPAFEVMWSMMWPLGHCAVASLCLAPLLRASLEIDFRVVVGRAANNQVHAWVETPEGDIVDPTYGQFDDGPALRVLKAHEAHLLGHCGEIMLDLDQEEHYRRSIKPYTTRDGWTARSGIKTLFSDHPIAINTDTETQ